MNNKEYTVSEVIDSFGMNKHTWWSPVSSPTPSVTPRSPF